MNLTIIYWIYENEQPELVNYFWNEFYIDLTHDFGLEIQIVILSLNL